MSRVVSFSCKQDTFHSLTEVVSLKRNLKESDTNYLYVILFRNFDKKYNALVLLSKQTNIIKYRNRIAKTGEIFAMFKEKLTCWSVLVADLESV